MKRIIATVIVLFLMAGCSQENRYLSKALFLRDQLMKSTSFSFLANIIADYGDKQFSFSMKCDGQPSGKVQFSVTAPESISGIAGFMDSDGGKLTFDETILSFPMLADGEVSPVSAPWLFTKTLLGGYISSAGAEGDLVRITMNDSYEDDALQVDIWLNTFDQPVKAEILWQGRRILSMTVENFQIL